MYAALLRRMFESMGNWGNPLVSKGVLIGHDG